MTDDDKGIAWATVQIRTLVNDYEGKRLPDWVVGAIHGYCNRIDREAIGLILDPVGTGSKT